jgi:TatA/E family protein of Tat protein translocase
VTFGEIVIVAFLTLVLFGPDKIPQVSRTIGKVLREFRKAMNELERSVQEHTAPVEEALSETRKSIQAPFNELRNATAIAGVEPVAPKPAKDDPPKSTA